MPVAAVSAHQLLLPTSAQLHKDRERTKEEQRLTLNLELMLALGKPDAEQRVDHLVLGTIRCLRGGEEWEHDYSLVISCELTVEF